MKRLTSTQLRTIRHIVIIAGMILCFIIWLFIPDVIKNNALVHVGNGEYGSKYGALIVVLIPLFGFIPTRMDEEIHTKDPKERAALQEKFDRRTEEIQLPIAIFCSLSACFAMLCGLLLCR